MSDFNEPEEGQPQEPEVPEDIKGKTGEEVFQSLSARFEEEADKRARIIVRDRMALEEERRQAEEEQKPQRQSERTFYNPPIQPQPQQQAPQEEVPDRYSDPAGYAEYMANQRIGSLTQQYVTNARAQNSAIFRSQHPEDYQEYGEQIEQVVNQFAPAVQANPQAYDMARTMVLGANMDKIVEKRTEEKAKEMAKSILSEMGIEAPEQQQKQQQQQSYFTPGSQVPMGNNPPRAFNARQRQKSRLTPEQQAMAKVFDMTEDEYLEYAEENTDMVSEARRNGGI